MLAEHSVYLYQHRSYLEQRVARFIREGMTAEETTIIVTTPTRHEVLQRLMPDLAERYIAVDVETYLTRFCSKEGILDQGRFLSTVRSFLDEARGAGRPIRLYGEGVSLLWDRGHRRSALELERWWNEYVLPVYPFSVLLCSYAANTGSSAQILDILGEHTGVALEAAGLVQDKDIHAES